MSFHINEPTKRKQATDDDHEIVVDQAPKDYFVNPSEIMVQVIHRSEEPVHPGIIEASYNWVDKGIGYISLEDPFGGWIHVTRNWQSRMFMARKEFKYLLLIDADESVPWWIPFQLAEHDLPIVSGIVCGFTPERGLFACCTVIGSDGKARFPTQKQTHTIPRKGLLEVHNAGTGCLMIRRDVVEALWAKYDKNPEFGQPFGIPHAEQELAAIQGGMPRGEDICFTDRCRELGFKTIVDWQCQVGHKKPFLMAWPDDQMTNMDPKKWAQLAFTQQIKKG